MKTLIIPTDVRLYKLYMSLCPADCPADSFYLMPLHNPSATCWYSTRLLGYHKLGTTVACLANRLNYQCTKPIILSRSLLQQDCMTQELMNSWSWKLLGTLLSADVKTHPMAHIMWNEPKPSARISYCKRQTCRAWERG